MQVRCEYCEKEYESTADACDHWPNGADTKCVVEHEALFAPFAPDDEAQHRAEGQIKQHKIDRRTGQEDRRWPDPNRGR